MTNRDLDHDAPDLDGDTSQNGSEPDPAATSSDAPPSGSEPPANASDLGDEAPPPVPDLADSAPVPPLDPEAAPADDGSDKSASPAVSRRLAPPPKPKGRKSTDSIHDGFDIEPVPVSLEPSVPKPPKSAVPPKPPMRVTADDLRIDQDLDAVVAAAAESESAARGQVEAVPAAAPASVAAVIEASDIEPPPDASPSTEVIEVGAAAPSPVVSGALSKPPPKPISIPDDDVPPKAPEKPKRAVMAMKILSVGVPSLDDEAPPELLDDLEVVADRPSVEPEVEPAEELDESEVAPAAPAAKPPPAEVAPAVAELPAEESKPPSEDSALAAKQPPPPPRRAATPPPPPTEESKREVKAPSAPAKPEPKPARPQRRPWWEELFCEDFARAHAPPTSAQVTREVDFIEKSLGVAPGGVVLDLGCGQGLQAVELSTRGYGVVGYDLSLFQLALAADAAQDRDQKINFLQGDMREMAFEEMFDGIFCWSTTFGYFEEEKNLAVAERMFRALRPGGSLLLDVANRDFLILNQPSQVWFEGDSCVCMDDMSVDFITSRLKVKRSIILDDGRTRETYYSIRIYSLHEIGKLLHDVGFRVTQASGDPATPGVFLGERSPRIIVLAQRPSE
jgi:SAM-dependent methyltransferase